MSRSPTTTERGAPLRLPPIHPGEILAEELDTLGLAAVLDLPIERVEGLLAGSEPLSADLALRLARWLGTSARFWMNLQTSYDLAIAERDQGGLIARQVQPRAA